MKLYEISFNDINQHGFRYTRKVHVLAKNPPEAMEKFLAKYPDKYTFTITNWYRVDIL